MGTGYCILKIFYQIKRSFFILFSLFLPKTLQKGKGMKKNFKCRILQLKKGLYPAKVR